MIARIRSPFGPRERSASTWFERNASASRLGTKFLPENATSNGSSPGTSSAAIRAGPRSSCRSSAAIRRGHPARPERDVGLGLPRDVGNAEAVADDRHARRAARSRVRARSLPEPERGRLEVAADVARRHVAAERGQAVVERGLVARVAVEREAAVLAGRQDRPGGGRVVALRRRGVDGRQGERRAWRGRPPPPLPAFPRRGGYRSILRIAMRVSGPAAGLQSPAWTPSSPSRRRSSRCASRPSSCGGHVERRSVGVRAPGRPHSARTRSPPERSPGVRPPAGTRRRFASTTSAARC